MIFQGQVANNETDRTISNILLTITFTIVSILGNPFLYDQVNSGRQIAGTLKKIDPELFPNDYVVAAFEHYRSIFYDGLSLLARSLNFEAFKLESLIFYLYLLSKYAIVISLLYISRTLSKSIWLFILLAAWSCHPKSIPVGGPGGGAWIFQPLLTHNDIAFIILMFSLYQLLKKDSLIFWILIGVTVFVHSLYAFHFILCVIPLIMHAESNSKRQWVGVLIFSLCCLAYLSFYAPPKMTSEEGKIFLEVEGNSGHISLFSQRPIHWLRIILLAFVSTLSHFNFTKSNESCKRLIWSAISGALVSILLSIVALYSHSVLMNLFQPMRMFIWVTLFFYIVLINATVEAFNHSSLFGIMLSAVLFLITIYSSWTPAISAVCLGFLSIRLLFQEASARNNLKIEIGLKFVLSLISAFLILSLMVKGASAYFSIRGLILTVSSVVSLILLLSESMLNKYKFAVASLFISFALLVASLDRHEYYSRSANEDWTAIRRWSQANTSKTDTFITPPEENTFRSIALRTSVSERNIETIWASPYSYIKNKTNADQAARAYTSRSSDVEYLYQLARKWHCNYVISKGQVTVKEPPVYKMGTYQIFKVPEI